MISSGQDRSKPLSGDHHRLSFLRRNFVRPCARDLYPGSAGAAADMLADKPAHWQGYFDGSLWTNLESPRGFKPCDLTPDQIREINALNHIENELIDEACGRVLEYLTERNWSDRTDVLFTTEVGLVTRFRDGPRRFGCASAWGNS